MRSESDPANAPQLAMRHPSQMLPINYSAFTSPYPRQFKGDDVKLGRSQLTITKGQMKPELDFKISDSFFTKPQTFYYISQINSRSCRTHHNQVMLRSRKVGHKASVIFGQTGKMTTVKLTLTNTFLRNEKLVITQISRKETCRLRSAGQSTNRRSVLWRGCRRQDGFLRKHN